MMWLSFCDWPMFAGLWGLVNNAAVSGKRGRIEWLTADDFRQANETDLYGVIDLTLTLLPLIKQEKGRIVNVSSFGGRVAMPYAVPYTVAKYGIESLTDVLRFSHCLASNHRPRPFHYKPCYRFLIAIHSCRFSVSF